MATSTPRGSQRYGDSDPGFRRLALAPGLIAALAVFIGLAIIEDDAAFTPVRYVVTILAAIVAVFAVQARQWWWVPPFAAIVVLWNPIWVLEIPLDWWRGAQYVAVIVFLLAGWLIRVAIPGESRPGIR